MTRSGHLFGRWIHGFNEGATGKPPEHPLFYTSTYWVVVSVLVRGHLPLKSSQLFSSVLLPAPRLSTFRPFIYCVRTLGSFPLLVHFVHGSSQKPKPGESLPDTVALSLVGLDGHRGGVRQSADSSVLCCDALCATPLSIPWCRCRMSL